MSAFHAHVLRFESGAVRFYIAYVRNSSALGRTYKIRLQVGCLCIILPPHGFNYHQLAPIVDLSVHAISSKLVHFCPNLARLPHYVYQVG